MSENSNYETTTLSKNKTVLSLNKKEIVKLPGFTHLNDYLLKELKIFVRDRVHIYTKKKRGYTVGEYLEHYNKIRGGKYVPLRESKRKRKAAAIKITPPPSTHPTPQSSRAPSLPPSRAPSPPPPPPSRAPSPPPSRVPPPPKSKSPRKGYIKSRKGNLVKSRYITYKEKMKNKMKNKRIRKVSDNETYEYIKDRYPHLASAYYTPHWNPHTGEEKIENKRL